MISPLEAHLGYWLRALSNLVSGAFAQHLAERDLLVPEWVVLRLLLDQPAAPSMLATRVGLTRGAMTKLVRRLADRGLLTLTAAGSGADRRFKTLELTPEGRALVPELAALADANDAAFFGHLGPAARDRMMRDLQALLARQAATAIPVD